MAVRVTIVVPADMQYEANQLALCLGTSARDVGMFGELTASNGMLYAGVRAPDEWVTAAQVPAVAPDFAPDADVTAARAAQAVLDVYTPDTAQAAQAGRITAVVGPDGLNTIPIHLAAIGLTASGGA